MPPSVHGKREDTEVNLIKAVWENQCCERRKPRRLWERVADAGPSLFSTGNFISKSKATMTMGQF